MPLSNPINSDLGADALNQWMRNFRPRFTTDLMSRFGAGFGQQKVRDPLDFPLPRNRNSQEPVIRRPFQDGLAAAVLVPNSSVVDPGDVDPRDDPPPPDPTPGLDTTPWDGTTPGDESTPGEGTTPGDESTEGPGEETTPGDGTTPGEGTTPGDGTTEGPGEESTPGDGPETPGEPTTDGGDTPGGLTTGGNGTVVIIGGGGVRPPWGGTPGEGQTGSSSSSSEDPCEGCATEHTFNAAASPPFVRQTFPPFAPVDCTAGNPVTLPCGGGDVPGLLDEAWLMYDALVDAGVAGAPPPYPRSSEVGTFCGCVISDRATGFLAGIGSGTTCFWAEVIFFTWCFSNARVEVFKLAWWLSYGYAVGTPYQSQVIPLGSGFENYDTAKYDLLFHRGDSASCCNPDNNSPGCVAFREANTVTLNGNICTTSR